MKAKFKRKRFILNWTYVVFGVIGQVIMRIVFSAIWISSANSVLLSATRQPHKVSKQISVSWTLLFVCFVFFFKEYEILCPWSSCSFFRSNQICYNAFVITYISILTIVLKFLFWVRYLMWEDVCMKKNRVKCIQFSCVMWVKKITFFFLFFEQNQTYLLT